LAWPLFSILGASLVGLWGCEQRTRGAPAATLVEDSADAERSVRSQLGHGLRNAKSRLEQSRTPPATRERQRCPDETLSTTTEDSRTLMMHVQDGRSEKKWPLPLELLASLESNEFETILAHIPGGAVALWDESHVAPPNLAAGRRALQALRDLEARRYLSELVVESYEEPKLFRRKDALRSEWAAGHLSGRIVVYDLHSGSALCQAPLRIRGDATSAPINRRLRESTRERLRRDLLNRTWAGMESALSSISSRLTLPPPTRRGDPSMRWAPPEPAPLAGAR